MSFDSIQYNIIELPVKENNFTTIVTVIAMKNGKVFHSFASASGNGNDTPDITEQAKAKALNDIMCNSTTKPFLESSSKKINMYSKSFSDYSNRPSEKQIQWMEKNHVTDETSQQLFGKNKSELTKKEAHELINSLWKK